VGDTADSFRSSLTPKSGATGVQSISSEFQPSFSKLDTAESDSMPTFGTTGERDIQSVPDEPESLKKKPPNLWAKTLEISKGLRGSRKS
jgi:hypothetical protein